MRHARVAEEDLRQQPVNPGDPRPPTFSLLGALTEYMDKDELQRTVLLEVATQIEAKQIQDLNAIFDQLDTQGEGQLATSVLEDALVKRLNFLEEEARMAVRAMDLGDKGKV